MLGASKFPNLQESCMNVHKIHRVAIGWIFLAWSALSPIVSARLIADHAITEGCASTASGVRIHYLQSGDTSSRRAPILIPDWRLPAYLWKEQLMKFAPVARVFAIDPRSQGPSTKTADGNTPETRASDAWFWWAGRKGRRTSPRMFSNLARLRSLESS
jgi:hypothetical protein